MTVNKLITGDNLEILKTMDSDTIDCWDFNYDKGKGFKPEVIIDKEGKQAISLKTGRHTIAVKVVDNDGLENMEVVKLTINGEVKRE